MNNYVSITRTRCNGFVRVYVKYPHNIEPNISDYVDITSLQFEKSIVYNDRYGNKFISLMYIEQPIKEL